MRWVLNLALGVVVVGTAAAAADEQVETFSGMQFNNAFFDHQIEFDDRCCWSFMNRDGNDVIHFHPNTDLITFDLSPGDRVQGIRVTIEDYEGGFVGNRPTSAIIVRAASGDFVALHASEIGVVQEVAADVDTLGQLTGEPLGEIVSIHIQAANEGNSVYSNEFGAYIDNITVVLVCLADFNEDGSLNSLDFLSFLNAFSAGDASADFNRDGSINTLDFLDFLNAFNAGCE